MKSNWMKWCALSLGIVLAGSVAAIQASAQQTQTSTTTSAGTAAGASSQSSSNVPPPGTIGQRKENQQDRIAQGVKSGQLTAGETANLESKEAGLNKEIRTDRKDNGGNLTNNQKKQINNQQNKLSKDIYKDKHNGRTQHGK
jgi:hypothetical protein